MRPVLAIIGSRRYRDLEKVKIYILTLDKDVVIVSGGARGVDCEVARVARLLKLDLVEILPDYQEFGNRAPLVRNEIIIALVPKVVAFWDGESTGTKYVIERATHAGKVVVIIP